MTNDSLQLRDFVETAIGNLEQIEANLRKLGYRFSNKRGAIGRIPSGTNQELARLKQKYESVPSLFFALYDRVEYIDFTQEKNQLSEPCGEVVAGLGLNCTLIFESLAKTEELQTLIEENGFRCEDADGKEFIPIGSYASNSMPKGIWLPNSSNDPIIYDAGAGPVSMGSELTRAIQAGGFPFWSKMFAKRRFTSPIPNTPKYLDILPVLMEGVVVM